MHTSRVVAVIAVCSCLCSCGDSSGPAIGPPAALDAVGGDNQQAEVGTALPVNISARVNDANGRAVPNIAVSFTVASGGGSVVAVTSTTDASGVATARWTLGTSAGTQTLTASVSGINARTFTATAKAAAPAQIEKVSGDAQSGVVASTTPQRPTVKVSDRYGNPVSGTNVNWSTSSGASVASPTSVTDAAGMANASWTLGNVAAAYKLTASIAGGGAVDFNATAQAGPAVNVAITPAIASMAWGETQQFTVTATDSYGNSVKTAPQWASSNTTVATISSTGLLTAKTAGNSTVSVTVDGRSAQATVSVSALTEKITVQNTLINNITVTVNDFVLGNVTAGATRDFVISTPTAVNLDWDIVRTTRTDGVAIGDQMGGWFDTEAPVPHTTFVIDHIIGTNIYFAPWLWNRSSATWLAGVNMGLSLENRCNCSIPFNTGLMYNLGYYKWMTGSNVRAYQLNSNYNSAFINWNVDNLQLTVLTGEIVFQSTAAPSQFDGFVTQRQIAPLDIKQDREKTYAPEKPINTFAPLRGIRPLMVR